MRVWAGALDSLPADRCVAVEGGAIVVRAGGRVVAFQDRCLHQATPLAGGWVSEGVLTCPAHFWRYSLPAGHHRGSGRWP